MGTGSDNGIPRKLIRTLLWDRTYPIGLRLAIRKLHASESSLHPVLYRAGAIEGILEEHPQYRETYINFPCGIMKRICPGCSSCMGMADGTLTWTSDRRKTDSIP